MTIVQSAESEYVPRFSSVFMWRDAAPLGDAQIRGWKMSKSSTERIDQLALVWLLVPRKESTPSDFANQLKRVESGAKERGRLARESIARLREAGMIQKARLELTDAGSRQALELLGISRLPGPRTTLQWVKKVLLLRSIGVEATSAALKTAGTGEVLAARILARHHGLDRHLASASKVLAVLARRALGVEETPSLRFEDAFSAAFLTKEPLQLAERALPEFASLVADAARSAETGRWHNAVFISHVWHTLQGRGDVGITFEKFKRRLVEAYQNDLLELSRADLVEAMPAEDVSASETLLSGARYHFVRVQQLAS